MLLFITLAALHGCNPSKSENVPTEKRAFIPQQNLVDTLVLRTTAFKKEIVSNGKLKALRKSELRFRISGQLQELRVHNGDLLKNGAVIAVLDPFEYRQRLDQAETNLRNAHIELRDVLMMQGYREADSLKVPSTVYEGASVRSGYTAARRDLVTARHDLSATVLKAPFSGKVANIKQKAYEQVSPGEVFCTLIDDSEFEVEFHLVESEIKEVSQGDEVKIIPYALEKTFRGHVSTINPLIDENGLLLVRARVKNPGALMEGMNVKVLVENEVPAKLVVPKQAVVLRQNQEVLFKYVKGKAFWTYVQTGQENSTSYTVAAHPEKGGTLVAGDTVIVSGNLNLAHESEVVIK
ncbi:efflux RND transporter periplasmic adaptor subunit [soil metagenome]